MYASVFLSLCVTPRAKGEWYRLGSFLVEYEGGMLIILQAQRSHKKGGMLRHFASRLGIQRRRHNHNVCFNFYKSRQFRIVNLKY